MISQENKSNRSGARNRKKSRKRIEVSAMSEFISTFYCHKNVQ